MESDWNRAEDLSGRTIGSYAVLSRIGAGGMGEVYKAHDSKLERPVALKLLPAHLAADPDRLRRFHAEVLATSSLNHPHILVIHDFGDLDGRPFIVTEFVEGQTLRQKLESGAIAVRDAISHRKHAFAFGACPRTAHSGARRTALVTGDASAPERAPVRGHPLCFRFRSYVVSGFLVRRSRAASKAEAGPAEKRLFAPTPPVTTPAM